MKTQPIQTNVSFGILKNYRKTSYGTYMQGTYKNFNIEVYDAKKNNEKLIYVSDCSTLRRLKYKFIYFHNGIKRILSGISKLI